MRIIIFLCLLILFSIPTLASFVGEPIVKNFSAADYKGGSRIYSILCTSGGLMYAGDKSGVLEFDGENWRKIECGFPVTSMCIDDNNVVYVSGNKGMGKLETNADNELKFVSLQHYFSEIHSESLRLSKVFHLDREVVFVLGREILVVSPDKLRIIESPHHFNYFQKLNNEILLYSPEDGIYKFRNSKLELITNKDEIKDLNVKGFYSSDEDFILLAEDGKSIKFDKKTVQLINSEVSFFVANTQCRNVFQINDTTFALNTHYNGFLIFNMNGNILTRYDYSNGLINNTVFCVYEDGWGNLWVGTGSGISAIRLHFPLTIYNNREGIGTGYCAEVVGEKVYLGTSQGLYLRKRDFEGNISFEKLYAGHIFALHKIDNELYMGNASGIYKIVNDKAVGISSIPGGWDLKQVPWSKNHFIATTVNGLILFETDSQGNFSNHGLIANTKWINKKIEFDSDGTIWAESKYGVTQFTLSKQLKEATVVEHFDRIEEGNQIVKVSKIQEDIYLIAENGIYTYNKDEVGFKSNLFCDYLIKHNLKPTNLFVDNSQKVWIFTNKKLVLFWLVNGKYNHRSEKMLEYAKDLYPVGYENICDLDSNYVLIGQEQGFLCYQKSAHQVGPYSWANIRRIQVSGSGEVKDVWGEARKIYNSHGIELDQNINYKNNSIKFYYSSGCSNYNEIKYQTMLVGYDKKWTTWSDENIREFTNLSAGDYKFVVRSINQTEEYSYIAYCNFIINSPWYFKKIALLCYVVLFILGVILVERYFRFRVKRIQRNNQKKQEEIQFRKEQELIKDKLIAERELIKLKNEKLKTNILYKSKELADTTMNVIEKNRFLTEIKTELETIKQLSEKNKMVTNDVAKVIRKINRGIDNEENWKIFEDYFDVVHESFFKKMKKKYPILTAKDLRLCAYLRMNLSTKEIAPLLNISVRGVEISRYRLRKKIGIEKEDNLIDFLLKI